MENEKLKIIKNWGYTVDIDTSPSYTDIDTSPNYTCITVYTELFVFQCSDITLELCIDKMYQDISNQIYACTKHI